MNWTLPNPPPALPLLLFPQDIPAFDLNDSTPATEDSCSIDLSPMNLTFSNPPPLVLSFPAEDNYMTPWIIGTPQGLPPIPESPRHPRPVCELFLEHGSDAVMDILPGCVIAEEFCERDMNLARRTVQEGKFRGYKDELRLSPLSRDFTKKDMVETVANHLGNIDSAFVLLDTRQKFSFSEWEPPHVLLVIGTVSSAELLSVPAILVLTNERAAPKLLSRYQLWDPSISGLRWITPQRVTRVYPSHHNWLYPGNLILFRNSHSLVEISCQAGRRLDGRPVVRESFVACAGPFGAWTGERLKGEMTGRDEGLGTIKKKVKAVHKETRRSQACRKEEWVSEWWVEGQCGLY